MLLWSLFALMTLGALFAVCWPLTRGQTSVRSGSDVVVYRDQLDEIDRDEAASLIGGAEAEAARVEVSRRLIAAVEASEGGNVAAVPVPPVRYRWATLAVSSVVVSLGAGLTYLALSSLTPDIQIVGTSLDELDDDAFRAFAHEAVTRFGTRPLTTEQWDTFAHKLHFVPQSAGPEALGQAVKEAEEKLGDAYRRLHYLSVPPRAAVNVIDMLRDADLVDRSRVVMEKPFGTDLRSAVELNRRVHETFSEDQIFRIDHFLGKEPALNILAFRFANGLFEPIWNRNFIDHVQIDVPEVLGLDNRADFYEATGAYKDMVVTHLFQIMAFVAMEPPTALEPRAISEEKNKVFRSLMPMRTSDVVRGLFTG